MADGVQESFRLQAEQFLPEERPARLEGGDPHKDSQPDSSGTKFKLTKCVTIQTHGQDRPTTKSNLTDKWMQYLHVSSGRAQHLSELPDNGHVLLHIDIPNQQVYPLPLLVTPVKCVYLITFDLPEGMEEGKKALKAIRDTLKDVYAYSKCLCEESGVGGELGGMNPEVFLVGLQREEEKDLSSFSQQLSRMLETRPYRRLIVVPPNGEDLYWINSGTELSIHENHILLSKINHNCCSPLQSTRQSLAFHYELLQIFKGSPFVLFEDLKAAKAGALAVLDSASLEKSLKVLHCLGFIFYCPLPGLEQSDKVIVLQPQYLRQLFVQVQERSKQRKWFTTEDLLGTAGEHIRDKQKWFLAMCMSMGLVIERSIRGQPNHIFVMGLERECNLPERAHYSVDPLLVTYGPEDMEQMDDNYLLPSPLFPAFINSLLKKLQERYKSKKAPIAMKRHYLHVSVQGSTHMHVVERDSFIEVGLQQFHMGDLPEGEQLKKLQQSCQDVYSMISKSAISAADSLRLDSDNIQYGFLCHLDNTPVVDRFAEFNSEDEPPTVTCSCCNIPQPPSPQQQIWFSNVDSEKVVVRPVSCELVGGSKALVRKLYKTEVPASQVEGQPQALQFGGQPQALQFGGQTQALQTMQTQLMSSVAGRSDHLMLFRTHVSRRSAGNGRAVLEGVGLDAPTIAACFTAHPQKEEDAVQEGLIKWCGGKGTQPPTWGVLIAAMDYAEISQQDIAAIKNAL